MSCWLRGRTCGVTWRNGWSPCSGDRSALQMRPGGVVAGPAAVEQQRRDGGAMSLVNVAPELELAGDALDPQPECSDLPQPMLVHGRVRDRAAELEDVGRSGPALMPPGFAVAHRHTVWCLIDAESAGHTKRLSIR